MTTKTTTSIPEDFLATSHSHPYFPVPMPVAKTFKATHPYDGAGSEVPLFVSLVDIEEAGLISGDVSVADVDAEDGSVSDGDSVGFFDRDALGSPSFFFIFSVSRFFLSISFSFPLLEPVLSDFGFDPEVDDGLVPDPDECEKEGAEDEALAMIRPKVIKTMRIASLSAFSNFISPPMLNIRDNYDIA
ncbi:uncharacterized protein IAS62_005772 [Cryptococcus decagattii]|uniref:Uncharacterized protein n=1 Tax=Cryptococcus decagattii TaxID=1859122 RepID=A0ABZ2B4M4_9TREE